MVTIAQDRLALAADGSSVCPQLYVRRGLQERLRPVEQPLGAHAQRDPALVGSEMPPRGDPLDTKPSFLRRRSETADRKEREVRRERRWRGSIRRGIEAA